MDVDKATALEELVNCLSSYASYAENSGEQVGSGSEVLNGTQELNTVALLLQGIVGSGSTLNNNLVCLQLKGLLGVRSQHQSAVYYQGGANILSCNLIVIIQAFPLKHDLQRLKAAAVIELDKTEVFHVTNSSDPAANSQALTVKSAGIGINAGNFLMLHVAPILSLCQQTLIIKMITETLYTMPQFFSISIML